MWLRHCVLCQRRQKRWCCRICWQSIQPYTAHSKPSWSLQLEPEGFPCISYAPYTGNIQQLIYLMKYHQIKGLAREMGAALGVWYQVHWPLPDAIVPIPLHPERERERGYNQSLLLARALGRVISRPVYPLIQRTRVTPRLYNLSPAERAAAMHSVFALAPEVSSWLQTETPRLLILDDILTSGSTLKSAFYALSEVSSALVGLTLSRADITDPLDL